MSQKVTNKKIIGMKELHQNLKDVADAAQKGKSFTVMRHSNAVFDITPSTTVSSKNLCGKQRTIDDLLALTFHSEDGNLSQRVDEIAYDL